MDAVALLGLTIVLVSIPAVTSIFVLQDAEKRGIENSVTWATIVALSFGVGIVLYLIRRAIPESEAEASEDAEYPLPGAERSDKSPRTDE